MDRLAPASGLIEEVEEGLDPRVHIELENLNIATNEINLLEATLEEANNSFRSSLNETSNQLQSLAKRLGNCIEKARPYYETAERAKKLQLDCQRAAIQFQRANVVHQAARETIALAEERFTNVTEKENNERKFDSAWQEMLNHATMKVMEAEAQKIASEREHLQIAATYAATQKELQDFQRSFKTAINKSRPYFHHRTATQVQLEAQKDKIHKLQKEISLAKLRYSLSLQNLEQISEEIHETRRANMKREPGVGAEVNHSPTFYENTVNEHSDVEVKLHEEHKYWKDLRLKLNELQAEDAGAMKEESLNFDENFNDRITNSFSALPHSDTLSVSYEYIGNCKELAPSLSVEHSNSSAKKGDLYSWVKSRNYIKKIVEVNDHGENDKLNLNMANKNEEFADIPLQGDDEYCCVNNSSVINEQPLNIAHITQMNLDKDLKCRPISFDGSEEFKIYVSKLHFEMNEENFLESRPSESEQSFCISDCSPTKEIENKDIIKSNIALNDDVILETKPILESVGSVTCMKTVQLDDLN